MADKKKSQKIIVNDGTKDVLTNALTLILNDRQLIYKHMEELKADSIKQDESGININLLYEDKVRADSLIDFFEALQRGNEQLIKIASVLSKAGGEQSIEESFDDILDQASSPFDAETKN
jgi:hypothetical protein